ncbi:MAG: radical SAM protein, partial [Bacillota bacterium]|nr:radical SAM protein [Bacillota bacterium]
TAELCNQLHPHLIGANMLTVYPKSELFAEIQLGNCEEESEVEKYQELKKLLRTLAIPVTFAAMGASNAAQLHGELPWERAQLLRDIDQVLEAGESKLRQYRVTLPHL